VVNLVLPDLTGDELINSLSAVYPTLPVLIISALVNVDAGGQPVRVAGHGPTAIVSKPFDLNGIVSMLAELIHEAEGSLP
jgi:FixJ family two-component response regulator